MTIEKITMPQLGESVTEGTITSWLVKPGEQVEKYNPIAEVMTDKVNAEVPSSYTGTIKEILVEEGQTIAVGEEICFIETKEASDSKNNIQSYISADDNYRKYETSLPKSTNESMKKRYSPAVLKLAQEHHIDLTLVEGTGRGSRITRKDLERLIESGKYYKSDSKDRIVQVPEKEDQYKELKRKAVKETRVHAGDKEIPVTGVRKAIADKMVTSTQEIPHAWMQVEADVTNLVSYRNNIKASFKEKEGYSITYFSFFVKAVAQALQEYPQLNSTWAKDKIIMHKDIHISIAVASEDQLFVPVIKNADELSIKGIAKRIVTLADKARKGKLTADDMSGGTFTVNNTGAFGSVQSMGVINQPQAAILQVESIVKRPVIIKDMFAARDMVHLCLSLDHRILDGLICGRFLARVKEILENTTEETMKIY